MVSRVKKFAPHLRVLASSSPKACKAIMKSAKSDLVRCLCECSMNILKGNVSITPGQMRKLSRHKKDLRFLAKRGHRLASKKRVLQKGGILPAILGPILAAVLPSVGGAVGNLIGRAVSRR